MEYLLLLVFIALFMAVAADVPFSALVSGAATVYAVLYFVTTLFKRKDLVAGEEDATT